MLNRNLVPPSVSLRVVRAPDDVDARQQAEHLEQQFRSTITGLRNACRVPPQPRWLFEDIASGKSMSATQLFRAFAILAKCPDVPEDDVMTAVDAFCAMLSGGRAHAPASLESLVVAETMAQAAADVLQLHATITDGRCLATAERALEATTKHAIAAKAVQRRLAQALGERFVVRRPSSAVASRER